MGTRLGPKPIIQSSSNRVSEDIEPPLNMTLRSRKNASATLSRMDNLSIRDEFKSTLKVGGPTPHNSNPFANHKRQVPILRYENSNYTRRKKCRTDDNSLSESKN